MKKFVILAALMTLALFIGVAGTALRAEKAQAKPTDIVAFSPGICVAFTAATVGEDAAEDICLPPPTNPTGGLMNPDNVADLAVALGADADEVNNPDTYKVLSDATDAQLGQSGDASQVLWVLTIVTNDENVTLTADEGTWLSTILAAAEKSTVTCDAAAPLADEDCDNNGTSDDKVFVDMLIGNDIPDNDRGEATITALGAASGIDVSLDYTVVGLPDEITIKALKDTIQEESTTTDEGGSVCDLQYGTKFADLAALPDVTGLLATVVDEDGTELTSIAVDFEADESSTVSLALGGSSISVLSSGVVVAPDLGCGGSIGSADITASTDDIDDETTVTVVGGPDSLSLAAPAAIACNGTNTADVSATVLGSDGKPVGAGNKVRFDVFALGTATPIIAATDAKGVATTKVTPLSGITAGVTVLATVLAQDVVTTCPFIELPDTEASLVALQSECPGVVPFEPARIGTAATEIEANTLVPCQPAVAPTTPPVVIPTPLPTVTPPRTGDGGYLP